MEPNTEAVNLNLPTEVPPRVEITATPLTNPSSIQKKGGRLLSVLLAVNILLIGCALISSSIIKTVNIQETEVFFLLTILMALAVVCMFIVLYYTKHNRDAVLGKDSHAGPVWLRAGLIFFGILTLVQIAFKIGYFVPLASCAPPIKVIYPVVQAVFVTVQTYFIWVTCRKCIRSHTNLTRYALMLILVTNLVVWMSAVTDEANHHEEEEHLQQVMFDEAVNQREPDDHTTDNHTSVVEHRSSSQPLQSAETCYCNTSFCQIVYSGYYYMYPFNIEYSLFACTLIYIMWRNVGRIIVDNIHHKKRPWKLCFCMPTYFLGIIFGLAVLAIGVVALTYYKVSKDSNQPEALTMLYIFGICSLSLMSIISLIGSIIYRYNKRDIVNHKNPSRTLDVTLLFGAALGQYCISYYSIVAIIACRPSTQLDILNLVYSMLVIAQLSFQNVFIIEGLHRLPYEDTDQHDSENPTGLFYANEPVISHFQKRDGSCSAAATTPPQEAAEAPPKGSPVTQGAPVIEESRPVKSKKTRWQRMIMREILLFLLLCNVIFWIIPSFGGRPQLRFNLEETFYGEYMWHLIIDVCLPFGIFYRLHAVASLVEVFMKT